MKFCDSCDNMLYIKLRTTDEGSKELEYACRSCGTVIHGKDTDTKSCVLDTNYADDQSSYLQFVTPYITHDPTLPRVNNIPCPNAACTRQSGQPSEVIFVKYDQQNLRFLYYCVYCKTFWKSGGGIIDTKASGPNSKAPENNEAQTEQVGAPVSAKK